MDIANINPMSFCKDMGFFVLCVKFDTFEW